jgi:hypothetical protein
MLILFMFSPFLQTERLKFALDCIVFKILVRRAALLGVLKFSDQIFLIFLAYVGEERGWLWGIPATNYPCLPNVFD